jgi:tripartite-type tricarboxylate transporter receptor subunit TctC
MIGRLTQKKKALRSLCFALYASLLMTMAGLTCAQSASNYPMKPVRVVIPSAPGTAFTLTMTALGDRMGHELGQNFLADYRPGAETVLGVGIAAKAAPDGYTLLQVTTSYLVNYWLNPRLPFDSLKDLTPVAMLGRTSFILAVQPTSASSLKDFISHVKANPGQINMAYSSSGGLLNFHMLMNAANIKFVPINYKGAPASVTSVIAGDTYGTLTTAGNLVSYINAGKLRALAVTGDKRNALLPDTPTFAEAGLKQFNPTNWFALLAPSRTPREIIQKLNVEVRRAQQSPEAVSLLERVNIDVFSMTVDQAEKFIRSEAAVYGKAIKDAGIKAEN